MTHRFEPDVVDAILRHMNDDHAADALVMVRGLGGQPAALRAYTTSVDGDGIDFLVETDGGSAVVRLPWSRPITARHEIRAEVVRLHQEACAALGITSDTEH